MLAAQTRALLAIVRRWLAGGIRGADVSHGHVSVSGHGWEGNLREQAGARPAEEWSP